MANELAVIETHLTSNLGSIAKVAARGIDPDRLVRVALTALQEGTLLHKCTPESVLLACLNAATIGLEPTGFLGDAYLVPYGETCNLQIGYKGLIKLMKRTGEVTRIEAHEVYNCDEFSYQYGSDPKIEHKPGPANDRTGLAFSYAIAWMRDGSQQFEVMTPDDIASIRSKSRGADNAASPWKQFAAMMWRKSAVRRLANYIELSSDVRAAMVFDDRATVGETISITEIDPTSEVTNEVAQVASEAKVANLADQLKTTNALAELKREIGTLVKSAGWPVETIGDFAQTVFGDGTAIVDMQSFGAPQFEELRDGIAKAILLRDGGTDVELTKNDLSGVLILPAASTIEA